jgi:hypothetical protein
LLSTLPRLGSRVRIPSPAPEILKDFREFRAAPRGRFCFPDRAIKSGEAWGKQPRAHCSVTRRANGEVAISDAMCRSRFSNARCATPNSTLTSAVSSDRTLPEALASTTLMVCGATGKGSPQRRKRGVQLSSRSRSSSGSPSFGASSSVSIVRGNASETGRPAEVSQSCPVLARHRGAARRGGPGPPAPSQIRSQASAHRCHRALSWFGPSRAISRPHGRQVVRDKDCRAEDIKIRDCHELLSRTKNSRESCVSLSALVSRHALGFEPDVETEKAIE